MKKLICDICDVIKDENSPGQVYTYLVCEYATSPQYPPVYGIYSGSGIVVPTEVELCQDCRNGFERAYKGFIKDQLGITL